VLECELVLRGLLVCLVCLLAAVSVRAEAGFLWLDSAPKPLLTPQAAPVGAAPAHPSLFVGRAHFFAPLPPPTARVAARQVVVPGPIRGILDLIASAEAGPAGYDAVVWAARVKPPKPPTQMTLGEIETWIRATPGQHHAIGRYQFIPATLRRLIALAGADPAQQFTPDFQDELAVLLLNEAGIEEFHNREIGRIAFMNNLAKIWAGLPNSAGRSHYHG